MLIHHIRAYSLIATEGPEPRQALDLVDNAIYVWRGSMDARVFLRPVTHFLNMSPVSSVRLRS
jgi:hypothetical protein